MQGVSGPLLPCWEVLLKMYHVHLLTEFFLNAAIPACCCGRGHLSPGHH